MTELKLGKIRMDGGTQSREELSEEKIDEYAELMRDGIVFPDIVVVYDGTNYWLVDGFHRVNAAMSADLETINCDVRQGTQDDAIWMSSGVNATHGMPRTNADKKRAVELALRHAKSRGMSDRQLAEHCGVSGPTIARYRKPYLQNVADNRVKTAIRGGKKYKIDTSNIGRKAADPKPESQEPAAIVEPAKPEPVEPPKEPDPPKPVVGTPTKLPTFDWCWAQLSKKKQDDLNGYPGSMYALKAFFELAQGREPL